MASEPHTVLIIEDDETLLEILKERLDAEGFLVLTAKDGESGLQTALSKRPDIILLDIVMPKLGGLSMLKQLREHPEGKSLRVIVLTNLNDTKDVHEALALGARDFLVKSDWAISDLVENIRTQLQQPFSMV